VSARAGDPAAGADGAATGARRAAPTLGVWLAPEAFAAPELAALAGTVESLGYETLWFAETFGRDPFALATFLGTHSERLRLGTGIANIFHRHAGAMRQGAFTVAEMTGGRFTLGLGVSSPAIVERARGIDYHRPLSQLVTYLDRYDESPYFAVPPPEPPPVVLAALGPKMLELAAARTAGALTYNMTPAHTATARAALGDGPLLAVEQKVLLGTDADQARGTAATVLRFYQRAPGYRRAWHSLGFTDADIDTPSAAFLDAVVAWGDADAVQARIDAHLAAGADHVCLQPLHPEHGILALDQAALRAFAPVP
jgi:probable F420-dependent oxidoreductase